MRPGNLLNALTLLELFLYFLFLCSRPGRKCLGIFLTSLRNDRVSFFTIPSFANCAGALRRSGRTILDHVLDAF